MTTTIFDKTDKGREEIATRKYRLAPRLRTLLLLVDGKQQTEELLRKLASMGVTEENLEELQNDGYIRAVTAGYARPAAMDARQEPLQQVRPAATPGARVLPDGKTQYEAVYQFYTETIKSNIGLRGYALQMKVEKAASIDELRLLRRSYLEAVQKSKGEAMAAKLRPMLDELLYYGEEAPEQSALADLNSVPLIP